MTQKTTQNLIKIHLTRAENAFLEENLRIVLKNLKKSEYRKLNGDGYRSLKRIEVKLRTRSEILSLTPSQSQILSGYLEGQYENTSQRWFYIINQKIKEYEA
jgi:hypothetical protein